MTAAVGRAKIAKTKLTEIDSSSVDKTHAGTCEGFSL